MDIGDHARRKKRGSFNFRNQRRYNLGQAQWGSAWTDRSGTRCDADSRALGRHYSYRRGSEEKAPRLPLSRCTSFF